jgi:hypothetical protein
MQYVGLLCKLNGMLNLGGFYIDEGSQLHYMIWECLLVD